MKPAYALNNEQASHSRLSANLGDSANSESQSSAQKTKKNEQNQLINQRMIIFSKVNSTRDLEKILSDKINHKEENNQIASELPDKMHQHEKYTYPANDKTNFQDHIYSETTDTPQFIPDKTITNNPIHIAQIISRPATNTNQTPKLKQQNSNHNKDKSETSAEHKPRSWASMFLQKLDKDANAKTEVIMNKFTFALPKPKVKGIIQQLRDMPSIYMDTLIFNECAREQIISECLKSTELVKWDLVEQPIHSRYILRYKVNKCNNAHTDPREKQICIDYHSASDLRRVPMYFQSRNDALQVAFNYMPFICQNRKSCKGIASCILAHNQYEIDYHPLMYKTRLCRYMSNIGDEFSCKATGEKCPYAHSAQDIRALLKLLKDNVFSANAMLNIHEDETTEFDVGTYKINKCEAEHCEDAKCINYHNKLERRRVGSYLCTPCKSVYYNNCFHDPNICKQNDGCNYCHTKNEFYYHKDNYKKSLCKRSSPCKYGGQCPDIHQSTCKCSKCLEEITTGLLSVVFECKHILCSGCNKCEESELCTTCGKKFTQIVTIPIKK